VFCPDRGEVIRLGSGSATWATVDEGRRYDSRVGSADPANVPDPGAIVVSESRSQIGILFGFLSLAFAVSLVRGMTGAQSTSGRAVVAVIFGILVLVCVRAWIMMIRRPARLEIAGDVIRYVPRSGSVSTLSRQQGDELRFVLRRRGPGSGPSSSPSRARRPLITPTLVHHAGSSRSRSHITPTLAHHAHGGAHGCRTHTALAT